MSHQHEERSKLAIQLIQEGKTNEQIFPLFKAKFPEDYNERAFSYQLDAMRKQQKYLDSTNICPNCQGKGRIPKT